MGTGVVPRTWWKVSGAVVLVVDAVLLIANASHHITVRQEPHGAWWRVLRPDKSWNTEGDGSFIELFGHLQLSVAAVLLLVLAFRGSRMYVFATWGCLFLAIVADDYLQLHETAGLLLKKQVSDSKLVGMDAESAGELGLWAVVALVMGAGLLLTHAASSHATRRGSWKMLGITVLLGVFVVGFELAQAVFGQSLDGYAHDAVVFAKTAGKLVTMTGALVLAGQLTVEQDKQ